VIMKSVRKLVPQTHWPLKRLALCLDCDVCFEITDACPACGSETWTTLARFLDWGRPEGLNKLIGGLDTRAEHIVVVSRDRVDLYEKLRKTLAGSSVFEVILDRRGGERRSGGVRPLRERRANADRRAPATTAPDRCAILVVDVGDETVKKPRSSRG
jgi:hypothetical protein